MTSKRTPAELRRQYDRGLITFEELQEADPMLDPEFVREQELMFEARRKERQAQLQAQHDVWEKYHEVWGDDNEPPLS